MIEYTDEVIRNLVIHVNKEIGNIRDATLALSEHVSKLRANVSSGLSKFAGMNSGLYKSYPYTVRIAPEIDELAGILEQESGRLKEIEYKYKDNIDEVGEKTRQYILDVVKPAKIIEVKEPLPNNCWFGDTMKGINLRPGYVDNDRTQQLPVCLNDEVVMGLVAGVTGAGKSVLVNCIIAMLLYEYPPWELNLVLPDGKAAEFGKFGPPISPPQVKVIGLSSSTNFYLSELEYVFDRMAKLQDISKVCGKQNKLSGLRKYLDMAIPAMMVVADEVAQNYIADEKGGALTVNKLNDVTQKIAQLGRSFRTFLLLCSQNFSGTISDKILKQFKLGIGLGCDASLSESIIGNPACAELLKLRGYCIANTNRLGGKSNVENNVKYKVAFQDTDGFDKDGNPNIDKFYYAYRCCKEASELLGITPNITVFSDNDQPAEMDYMQDRIAFKEHLAYKPLSGVEGELDAKIPGFTDFLIGEPILFKLQKPNLCWFRTRMAKDENIFICSRKPPTLEYFCRLLQNSLDNSPHEHKAMAFIRDVVIFPTDTIRCVKKDFSQRFEIDKNLNTIMSLERFLTYSMSCGGSNQKMTKRGYLLYLCQTEARKPLQTFLASLSDEVLELPNLYLTIQQLSGVKEAGETPPDTLASLFNTLEPMLSGKLLDIYAELVLDLKIYESYDDKIIDGNFEQKDLRRTVYWFFGVEEDEAVNRGGYWSDKFEKLVEKAPKVGITCIFISSKSKGSKTVLKHCKHVILSDDDSYLENLGEIPPISKKINNIGLYLPYSEGGDSLGTEFKLYSSLDEPKL